MRGKSFNISGCCCITPYICHQRLYVEFKQNDAIINLSLKQWSILEQTYNVLENYFYFGECNTSKELSLTNGVFIQVAVSDSSSKVYLRENNSIYLDSTIFECAFYRWVNESLQLLDTQQLFHI